ncbi:hypothetical protein BV25DRAFT_623453 [Artomyces pyxidatus]|uniref:Uncharacterized protein n=1 Tax=Artomyces pyxidatus TaxID=48021 RepID=A0ACB8T2W4_9AGAM|nr:hypothetical protein BV25DRAFT_623453 [Artomyces pyxidatus]
MAKERVEGVEEDATNKEDISLPDGRRRIAWSLAHQMDNQTGILYYCGWIPRLQERRSQTSAIAPGCRQARKLETGEIVPPTENEIRRWSQGDALSKGLAVVQTLWCILQCIVRRAEGLPITQLEVMTLAYTTIAVAMYATWQDKPQNVGSPVRVAVLKELPPGQRSTEKRKWYELVFAVIAGMQDDDVDLRVRTCVPTFYSRRTHNDNAMYANLVALGAAMVFGAIHCAAWHYAFPSHAEEVIWRVSSTTIAYTCLHRHLEHCKDLVTSLTIATLPGAMLVPILSVGFLLATSDCSILQAGLEGIMPLVFVLTGSI